MALKVFCWKAETNIGWNGLKKNIVLFYDNAKIMYVLFIAHDTMEKDIGFESTSGGK